MEKDDLAHRIEIIEAGYEYLLAYAAQGRQNDTGVEARQTLVNMHAALDGIDALVDAAINSRFTSSIHDAAGFVDAVRDDASKARCAIGLVLGRADISSLLVDNLNASIHLRALLTDVFLVEQALKS